jgi:transposase
MSKECSMDLYDGRQFESLYESLDPENLLESAIMDKGYDADRSRERLSYDGVQAVIPPIPTRAETPLQSRPLSPTQPYRTLFNKLKHFRRIATRYDKLRKSLLRRCLHPLSFHPD